MFSKFLLLKAGTPFKTLTKHIGKFKNKETNVMHIFKDTFKKVHKLSRLIYSYLFKILQKWKWNITIRLPMHHVKRRKRNVIRNLSVRSGILNGGKISFVMSPSLKKNMDIFQLHFQTFPVSEEICDASNRLRDVIPLGRLGNKTNDVCRFMKV